MAKRITAICLSALFGLGGALPASSGGALETIDITGFVPSPIPGQLIAKVIGIKWDSRCIPVAYSVNDTLDPIPNPLGPSFLPLADATTALQNSFAPWNEIPTSFIDMQITGTTSNPGLRGFDFVNELTFRTSAAFGAIASSPSVGFIADVVLADGDDIDGDGDSDVSNAITTCTDIDSDGDIEFPPGPYEAGTILDNDVQYNTKMSNGFRFTVNTADIDTVGRSVDLMAVAVHENGHSHGLSHDLNNQISRTDGTGSTMFPFIDTGDPAAELAQRTLDGDDIAFSSFFYPEGSEGFGPGALQAGDIAFENQFGLIQGEVNHGELDQPVAGASLSAIDLLIGRSLVSSAFSGTTQLSFDPATGGLFLVSPDFNILNGNYVMPVPLGFYRVGLEAVDGLPVSAGSISLTAQIGALFGQQNFNEEFFNGDQEGALEVLPGTARTILVLPGTSQDDIDLITNRSFSINNFGNRNFIGFTGAPPGRYYAVRIPAEQIAAINPGEEILIQAAAFNTVVVDASVAPIFAEAILATGVVNPDGTASVNLTHPLDRVRGFIGQDNDFAPFYFHFPGFLGRLVRIGFPQGVIRDLFLVLRIPTETPFPGVSAVPPLIGLDGVPGGTNDVPIFGFSYVSDDEGASFTQVTQFNFMFSLILSEVP
jgi:hypothetical protein